MSDVKTGTLPTRGDFWRSGEPPSSRRHRFRLGAAAEADPRNSGMSRAKGSSQRREENLQTRFTGVAHHRGHLAVDTSPSALPAEALIPRQHQTGGTSRLRIGRRTLLLSRSSVGAANTCGIFSSHMLAHRVKAERLLPGAAVRRAARTRRGIVLRLNDRKKVNG